ncbi:uncharacterized protein [Haliotis asinina]|uniref:uncharacterized protein n=1 Tax=Haliotis asinina TaxID=109174 RepID=UPI0035326399
MSCYSQHCSFGPLDRMTGQSPGQYRAAYHKTPTKRKYEEVDTDEYGSVIDHGYYSPSPVYSHGPQNMSDCGRCCQDDAGVGSRRPPRDQFTGYVWQPHQSTLRNICETTPAKAACCQRRRCYTDTKHLENTHHLSRCTVPWTCLKSRKRLCFDSSNHERQSDSSSEFKFTHVRDLRYDMESLDVRATPKSEFFFNVNNEGPRIQPCFTPVHQATAGGQLPLCNSPLQTLESGTSTHQRQRIHGNLQTASQSTTNSRSCKCADLQQGFVTLAANAFINLRRKDSSAESFQQFKTEIDRTNEFLKQTLEMLTTFQDLCGH